MQNVTFTRSVRAKVELTADQWELFTASMDCTEAAYALNRAAERAIANCTTARGAFTDMLVTMREYSNFGAMDSEPLWVAESLFIEAFCEE